MKLILLTAYFLVGFTAGSLYNVAIESAKSQGQMEIIMQLDVRGLSELSYEDV